MGLFKTIKNIFRGAANDLNEALSDSERDGELGIKDAEASIVKYRTNIAALMTDTKVQEKKLTEAKKKEDQWQSVLDRAIDANKEEDAQKAHAQLAQASESVATLSGQIEKNSRLIAKMKKDLSSLQNKIATIKNKMSNLKATNQSSDLRIKLAKSHDSIGGDDSPFAALDKFEKSVNSKEAEAESWEELAGEGNESEDLLEKYNSTDTGFDFAALKRDRKSDKKK